MVERKYLNPVGHDAVDEDVVRMDHGFARAGNTAGTVKIGVVGQAIGCVSYCSAYTVGRRRVSYFDIIDDAFEFS